MGAIADAIAAEPDVRFIEDIPGNNQDISGYDPMDFGDDNDDVDDFTPDEIAEDVTEFAGTWKSGPPVPQPAAKVAAEPEEAEEPKEKKGNIFAENRILKRDMKLMEQRFSQLLEAISNRNEPEEEEEEEEDDVVPFEQDPLTHLAQKIGSVDKKMEQQKIIERQREQQKVIGQYLEKADEYTNQVIEKIGPQYWDEAMEHLANVRIEDFLERNPNKTRNEASELIGAAIINEKIRLVAAGRNPAEVYLKDAFRFGYKPANAQPARVETPAKVTAPNPKDQIRAQNNKAQNTRTTAGMNGAPAKQKLSAKAVVGMAERDFRDLVDDVTKDRRSEPRLRDFILPNS